MHTVSPTLSLPLGGGEPSLNLAAKGNDRHGTNMENTTP